MFLTLWERVPRGFRPVNKKSPAAHEGQQIRKSADFFKDIARNPQNIHKRSTFGISTEENTVDALQTGDRGGKTAEKRYYRKSSEPGSRTDA